MDNNSSTSSFVYSKPKPEEISSFHQITVDIFGEYATQSVKFESLFRIHKNCPGTRSFQLHREDDFLSEIDEENRVAAFGKLGEYFGKNTYLEVLTMHSCDITYEEMVSFCEGFQNNRSIRSLSLQSSRFGVEGLRCLLPFVENNSCLRELDLGFNHESEEEGEPGIIFGDEGVSVFCQSLRNRNNLGHPALEKIQLMSNGINSEGIHSLMETLTQIMPGLKELALGWNNFGVDGFAAIGTFLNHPKCTLTKLGVHDNPNISDEVYSVLADHLKHNSTVEDLDLTSFQDDVDLTSFQDNPWADRTRPVTSAGVKALKNLLWDKSSINATYSSNHTLTSFGEMFAHMFMFDRKVEALVSKVQDYLRMNYRGLGDPRAVARKKVFRQHFNTRFFDIEPIYNITDTTAATLPHVLAFFAIEAHPINRVDDICVEKAMRPFCGLIVNDGRCSLADSCPLVHDIGESLHEEASKNSLCPYFVKKSCKHGNGCPHKHKRLEGQVAVYDWIKFSTVYSILRRNVTNAFKT